MQRSNLISKKRRANNEVRRLFRYCKEAKSAAITTDMEILGAGTDPFAVKASSMLGRESLGIGFSVSIASA